VTDTSSKQAFRIGLTGGIASGKSTVADMFAELGVAIIDTDIIAREVVQPGEPALDEIRDLFGDSVIEANGGLDRSAMRNLVFSNDEARRDLESILHPRIGASTRQQSEAADGPYQIIAVPLLVGSPLRQFVDRVLVVDCQEDIQIQRLMARDSESIEQARRILAAQSSREERLNIADDVVRNDESIEKTRQRVMDLDRQYRRLAAQPCPPE
jgi:dephospho-CoA kinase